MALRCFDLNQFEHLIGWFRPQSPFFVAMRWARNSEVSVLRPRTLGRGSEPAGSFRGFDFTPATLSSRSGSRVFEADCGSIDFRGLSNADTLNTGVAAPIWAYIRAPELKVVA